MQIRNLKVCILIIWAFNRVEQFLLQNLAEIVISRFKTTSVIGVCFSWLWVQNWLFHKMVTVVNAPSPAWNRYWVCLKGTVLLFYLRQQTSLGGQNDRNPRHSLGKFSVYL